MTRELPTEQVARLEELRCDRATVGLDDAERAELARLVGGDDDDLALDLAAAAVELAELCGPDAPGALPPMPAGLADAILAAAPKAPAKTVPATAPVTAPVIPIGRARPRATAAWVTAAVGLAAGVTAVIWATQRAPEIVTRVETRVETRTVEVAPVEPPPAEARARLLATAKDVTTLAWTATEDPAAKGVRGDVVWSESSQRGYMRFVGLAPNDKSARQYQLWIFDKARDDKYPIDGGVFDVSPDGEVIVPIVAKIHVDDPALFAVTIERPGGVVVSKREHIVVVAKPS